MVNRPQGSSTGRESSALLLGAHDAGVGDDKVDVAGGGGDVRGGGFEGRFASYVTLERDDFTLGVVWRE